MRYLLTVAFGWVVGSVTRVATSRWLFPMLVTAWVSEQQSTTVAVVLAAIIAGGYSAATAIFAGLIARRSAEAATAIRSLSSTTSERLRTLAERLALLWGFLYFRDALDASSELATVLFAFILAVVAASLIESALTTMIGRTDQDRTEPGGAAGIQGDG
jgi:hypothetical protein